MSLPLYDSYKDSGVEWIGEIPEGWEVKPLRWYSNCFSGDGIATENISSEFDDEKTVPVIGGNGVMGYTIHQNIDHPVLAVGRVGALCGNVHIVCPPAWITDNALVLDASSVSYDIRYLSSILIS